MNSGDNYSEIDFSKAPFRFYEVVEIHPLDFETEPDVINLVGKRGAITGMAFDDALGWSFSVAIQSGENWCFDEAELKTTGIVLERVVLYGEPDESKYARIRVDPVTGEGICVAGNANFLHRLTPLNVNLDELKVNS